MSAMVECQNLTKSFGEKLALDNLTLSFNEGVVGLVGLNGSGKTTLLSHISGLYLPNEGSVKVFGEEAGRLSAANLARIGMVQQDNRFLEWMRVSEHIRYIAKYYETWNEDLEHKLLDELDLDSGARVGSLSPGNLQKLGVILATCHCPELLIMDEPASALDPISRRKFISMILSMLDYGIKCVVISSHVLTDVEKIVDRIVCLHHGRLQLDMPMDELYETFAVWSLQSAVGNLPSDFHEPWILRHEGNQHACRLMVKGGDPDTFAQEYGVTPQVQPLNLEQIFPLIIGAR